MFEMIIEAGRLQAFIDSLSCLVNEAKIRVDHEDGFEARAVDPANVAMVQAEINVQAFESFDSGKGVIGLDIGRFDDIVDFASASDLVHLEWNEKTRKMDVTIVTDGGEFEYELALFDPESIRAEPDIPDLTDQLTERFTITGSQFDTAIDAVTLAGDHVNIETFVGDVASHVEFHAEGDADRSTWKFEEENCIVTDISTAKASLYSSDYFEDMVKPIPSDAEVSFRLGDEFSTKWEYEADDGVEVLNMLAPRIQSD